MSRRSRWSAGTSTSGVTRGGRFFAADDVRQDFVSWCARAATVHLQLEFCEIACVDRTARVRNLCLFVAEVVGLANASAQVAIACHEHPFRPATPVDYDAVCAEIHGELAAALPTAVHTDVVVDLRRLQPLPPVDFVRSHPTWTLRCRRP